MALFSVATLVALTRYKLFLGINDFSKEELLSRLTDIVIIIDGNYKIAYVNQPGLERLGSHHEAVVGRVISSVLTCPSEDGSYVLDEEFLSNLTNKRCFLQPDNGPKLPFLVNSNPVVHGGEELGFVLVCRDISDVEEAQMALLSSERRFKKIIERSQDAVAIINPTGVIEYITDAVTKIIGYKPEEIVGKHFMQLIHPDSVEAAAAAFASNISLGSEDVEKVYVAVHKQGHPVYIEAVAENYMEDPDIGGLVTTFRDVSERHRIQQERIRSLAIFQALVQHVNVGILVTDTDRKIFHVNPKFREIFSLTASLSALKGTDWRDTADGSKHLLQEPDKFLDRIEEISTAKRPVVNETIAFVDGRICERDYYPIWTEEGEFMGHIWRYVDVTSKRKNQQDILEKNKLLELSQELGKMGSWIADLRREDGAVWSKEALEIYGLTEEEFGGKGMMYFDFLDPEDAKKIMELSQEAMAKHEPYSIENRIFLRDGTVKWVHSRTIAQYEGDQPVRLLGIVQDITERKEFENELSRQNRELVKVNTELDRFVYSASHDIRAPLMSVLGLVNLAKEENNDPGVLLYFEMIENRIHKLDEFTKDIIHYSKNARTEVLKEDIYIKELLEEIVESLKYQELAQAIHFDLKVSPQLTIQTDRSRLHTVLSNLISNAIKYRRDIDFPEVRLCAEPAEDNKVTFRIEDNGEGIPEAKMHKLFDMFTRFSERSTGSGLGLYIVKEIVDKLQGHVEVESTPGEGSAFRVILPCLE